MKKISAAILLLAAVAGTARADSATYFDLSASYGEFLSASGDPACVAVFRGMVDALKKTPPVTRTYLLYRGGISSDPERGAYNYFDNTFYVGVSRQLLDGYHYDRVFSGIFLNAAGRVDVTAEACRVAYKASFVFSNVH